MLSKVQRSGIKKNDRQQKHLADLTKQGVSLISAITLGLLTSSVTVLLRTEETFPLDSTDSRDGRWGFRNLAQTLKITKGANSVEANSMVWT